MTPDTSRWLSCRALLRLLPAVALLGACRPTPPPHGIRIALPSAPISLDPHRTGEVVSFIVQSNIYDTLVRLDDDLALTPSLARRWTNPDERTCDFDLAGGVHFHDGTLLTAADVAYSLRRAQGDPLSEWKVSLAALERVEAPTPTRIVVRTSQPFPLLLPVLSAIAIVPRHAGDLDARPIGTGPYRFVSRDRALGIVRLERAPGRAGPPPPIRDVSFHAMADQAARVRGIVTGEVDMVVDMPPGARASVAGGEVQVLSAPGLRQMFLGFDVARPRTPYASPARNPFRDRRVRLAVLRAIDTQRLVDGPLGGAAEEATQLVPRRVVGYDPAWKKPSYDLEAARMLLADAGFGRGFTARLDAPRDVYPGDMEVAQIVAGSLRRLGLDIQVNALAKEDLFRRLAARDTSFYMMSWNSLFADLQDTLDSLLHSPDPARGLGADNAGGYENARLDALAELAARTMTHSKRVATLRAAAAVALEDCPWVPLYVQSNVYGLRRPFRWRPRSDARIEVEEIEVAPH